MNDQTLPLPRLDAEALGRVAGASPAAEQGSCACSGLRCPGWESLPAGFEDALLQQTGTLVDGGDAEPTLDEFHPQGTNYWSADAPIALDCFPYNRAEVWQCRRCARAFLRYTEYGGYYIDPRIREVDPRLIVPGGSTAQHPAR